MYISSAAGRCRKTLTLEVAVWGCVFWVTNLKGKDKHTISYIILMFKIGHCQMNTFQSHYSLCLIYANRHACFTRSFLNGSLVEWIVCGRSRVRAHDRTNQRLCNWYLWLFHWARSMREWKNGSWLAQN